MYRRGVGAGGGATRVRSSEPRTRSPRNLFQRSHEHSESPDLRYYLWLWIGAVYKFGGTLTDYKYRLSRSEYIISSFIISNLGLERRATTAATNKFRPWVPTRAMVINSA